MGASRPRDSQSVPTATVLVIPATQRLIVLKVAGATTMALASGTLSGSSGSRHRWRTGKPVMASSSGASMNASASRGGGDGDLPAGRLCELYEVLDVGGGGRGADDHVEHAAGLLLAHPCHLATVSDKAVIPVWRTRRCRLLRGLRRSVAEGGEQLGGGAVLGGLEVGVGPQSHVRAGVAGPAGRGAPVHTLGDQVGDHQVPKVVQAAAQPERSSQGGELVADQGWRERPGPVRLPAEHVGAGREPE